MFSALPRTRSSCIVVLLILGILNLHCTRALEGFPWKYSISEPEEAQNVETHPLMVSDSAGRVLLVTINAGSFSILFTNSSASSVPNSTTPAPTPSAVQCPRPFFSIVGPFIDQSISFTYKPCPPNITWELYSFRTASLCNRDSSQRPYAGPFDGVISLLGSGCWAAIPQGDLVDASTMNRYLALRTLWVLSPEIGVARVQWRELCKRRTSTAESSASGSEVASCEVFPHWIVFLGLEPKTAMMNGDGPDGVPSMGSGGGEGSGSLPGLNTATWSLDWLPIVGTSTATPYLSTWTVAGLYLCGGNLAVNQFNDGTIASQSLIISVSAVDRCMKLSMDLLFAMMRWTGLRCNDTAPGREVQESMGITGLLTLKGPFTCYTTKSIPPLWIASSQDYVFPLPLANASRIHESHEVPGNGQVFYNYTVCIQVTTKSDLSDIVLGATQFRSIPFVADPVLGKLGVLVKNTTKGFDFTSGVEEGACLARRQCADVTEDYFLHRRNRCLDPGCSTLLFKQYDLDAGTCSTMVPLIAAIVLAYVGLAVGEVLLIRRVNGMVMVRVPQQKAIEETQLPQ
jgi:hypothetical protein